jgi:hypothetical protein
MIDHKNFLYEFFGLNEIGEGTAKPYEIRLTDRDGDISTRHADEQSVYSFKLDDTLSNNPKEHISGVQRSIKKTYGDIANVSDVEFDNSSGDYVFTYRFYEKKDDRYYDEIVEDKIERSSLDVVRTKTPEGDNEYMVILPKDQTSYGYVSLTAGKKEYYADSGISLKDNEVIINVEFNVNDSITAITTRTTNYGIRVMNRVMATVIAALKEFKKHIEKKSFVIRAISYEPSELKQTGISRDGRRLRGLLYSKYIKKHLDVEKEDKSRNIFYIKEALEKKFRLTQDPRYLDDLFKQLNTDSSTKSKVKGILDFHKRRKYITLSQLNFLKQRFNEKLKVQPL